MMTYEIEQKRRQEASCVGVRAVMKVADSHKELCRMCDELEEYATYPAISAVLNGLDDLCRSERWLKVNQNLGLHPDSEEQAMNT